MTNDHIQRILAATAQTYPSIEILELLRELFAPGGAVQIADEAAWDSVQSECNCTEIEGVSWYQVHNSDLGLDLADELERSIWERLSISIAYLGRRGLLHTHPEHKSLARLAEVRP